MKGRTTLAAPIVVVFSLAIAVVQMTPLVIVALVSLSPSAVFDLPDGTLSTRWYERLMSTPAFWRSMALSAEIAAISTAAGLVLGTCFAVGLARRRFPGSEFLTTCVMSPLMLPGIVLGIAFLNAYRFAGLRDAFTSLIIAHIVVTLPYVVRILLGALQRFDFTLIEAAQTLGVSYRGAILKVLLPNLAVPMATAAVFAFLASFDNYPISLFLVDAKTKTLPILMLQYLEESTDPKLAAASTLLLLMSLVGVVLIARLAGLNRVATERN